MTIIDARVRLPQDRRPSAAYSAPRRQTEQYDKVLDLTDKMNEGTLARLLQDLDASGVNRAVMHAESEGGEDGEALNDALLGVLDEHGDRFVGIGCLDVGGRRPTEMATQVARIGAAGLLGVTLQPAFFGLDIDARLLYPAYARAEELGLIVCVH